MALPLPSTPEIETLPRSPLPVRTTGSGGVFTSMVENSPWLVLVDQSWLERDTQSSSRIFSDAHICAVRGFLTLGLSGQESKLVGCLFHPYVLMST